MVSPLSGRQRSAVRAESQRRGEIGLAPQDVERFARRHTPEGDCPVQAARRQRLAVWAERGLVDLCFLGQGGYHPACRGSQHPEAVVCQHDHPVGRNKRTVRSRPGSQPSRCQ